MANQAPITLAQLFRFKRPWGEAPHQDAAIIELEADLAVNQYAAVMRRDRPWFKTWSQAGRVPDAAYLKLTRTKKQNANGLELLRLEYIKSGATFGSILVVSGAPGAQFFRTGAQSRAGSLEPLPEGCYRIGDIAWASGRPDDWSGSWGAGLGPVSVPLEYAGPGATGRSAIEIHIDWNARVAPGTAGCIGVSGEGDFRKLVQWLRDSDPRDLYVDYGLGTVRLPR